MPEFKDLTGEKINDFTVLRRVENKHRKARWLCVCKCGAELILYTSDFSGSRNVKCCRKCFMATFVKHGKTNDRVYHSWMDMKSRCDNPNNNGYKNYGGRGIKYCDEWANFLIFYQDMGDPPTKNHTLERKNVNEGYSPGNCVWATKKEQGRNKRTNVFYEIDGVTKCLSEWCEVYGQKYLLVFKRLKAGWPLLDSLKLPSLGQNRIGSSVNYRKTLNESIRCSNKF